MINPIHDLFISLARNSHKLYGYKEISIVEQKTNKQKLDELRSLHFQLIQAESLCSEIRRNKDNKEKIINIQRKIKRLKDLIPKLESNISS